MDESVRPPPRAVGWYRNPPGGYEYGYWDGSAWRQDVSAAVHLMEANSTVKFFMLRGALARIGELVSNDETVNCIGAGTYYSRVNRRVSVVLTDRRLLLLGGRRLATFCEFPLESISSAKPVWGGLMVIADGRMLSISDMNAHDRDEMAQAIQDASSGRRTRPAPPRRPAYDLGKVTRWRVTEE
jgi:hypothetical protein